VSSIENMLCTELSRGQMNLCHRASYVNCPSLDILLLLLFLWNQNWYQHRILTGILGMMPCWCLTNFGPVGHLRCPSQLPFWKFCYNYSSTEDTMDTGRSLWNCVLPVFSSKWKYDLSYIQNGCHGIFVYGNYN